MSEDFTDDYYYSSSYTGSLLDDDDSSEESSDSDSEKQNTFCEICKCECGGVENYRNHINGNAHKQRVSELNPVEKIYNCDICKINMTRSSDYQAHLRGRRHKERVIEKKKENGLFCFACEIYCPNELSMTAHRKGVKHITVIQRKKGLYCEKCDYVSSSKADMIQHRKGPKHNKFNKQKGNPSFQNKPSGRGPYIKSLYCDICKVQCNSKIDYNMHRKGKKHKERLSLARLRSSKPSKRTTTTTSTTGRKPPSALSLNTKFTPSIQTFTTPAQPSSSGKKKKRPSVSDFPPIRSKRSSNIISSTQQPLKKKINSIPEPSSLQIFSSTSNRVSHNNISIGNNNNKIIKNKSVIQKNGYIGSSSSSQPQLPPPEKDEKIEKKTKKKSKKKKSDSSSSSLPISPSPVIPSSSSLTTTKTTTTTTTNAKIMESLNFQNNLHSHNNGFMEEMISKINLILQIQTNLVRKVSSLEQHERNRDEQRQGRIQELEGRLEDLERQNQSLRREITDINNYNNNNNNNNNNNSDDDNRIPQRDDRFFFPGDRSHHRHRNNNRRNDSFEDDEIRLSNTNINNSIEEEEDDEDDDEEQEEEQEQQQQHFMIEYNQNVHCKIQTKLLLRIIDKNTGTSETISSDPLSQFQLVFDFFNLRMEKMDDIGRIERSRNNEYHIQLDSQEEIVQVISQFDLHRIHSSSVVLYRRGETDQIVDLYAIILNDDDDGNGSFILVEGFPNLSWIHIKRYLVSQFHMFCPIVDLRKILSSEKSKNQQQQQKEQEQDEMMTMSLKILVKFCSSSDTVMKYIRQHRFKFDDKFDLSFQKVGK